jgi:hypothetical protein
LRTQETHNLCAKPNLPLASHDWPLFLIYVAGLITMSSTYRTLGQLVNTHEAYKMAVTQDMERCIYYSYSNVALSQYARDRGSQSHHHHLSCFQLNITLIVIIINISVVLRFELRAYLDRCSPT